ncbi:MAG: hypothetical protein HFH49_10620 [Lachnospiraceae bacterium]|nr:hypothetical protein [Lachnospiraceae bacterium]
MKKKLISVVGLFGCFVLLGITAQAGRKSFYESQANEVPVNKSPSEHVFQESTEQQADFSSNSKLNEIILYEGEGEREVEFCEGQPNSAPIFEAELRNDTGHEYIK